MININFFKRNIFLIIFFIISFIYGYSIINKIDSQIYFFKPFIILSILIHYVLRASKINTVFLVGLSFAFCGDLLFNIVTPETIIIAMGCFLIFNLVLMLIATERVGVLSARKLLITTVPFLILFLLVLHFFFDNIGNMQILIITYGAIVVLLGSFSLNTYLKNRDNESLLFFIGSLFFVVASVSKGLKEFSFSYSEFYINITNIISYVLSIFFFSQSLILNKADKPSIITPKQFITDEDVYMH